MARKLSPVLGTKGKNPQSLWIHVLENHRKFVTKHELESACATANKRLDAMRHNFGSRFSTAWSGGKDSLVVYDLSKRAGQAGGVYSAPSADLEYTWFKEYLTRYMPKGVTRIFNGIDIEWLRKHPHAYNPGR